jgi:hypothetical protein
MGHGGGGMSEPGCQRKEQGGPGTDGNFGLVVLGRARRVASSWKQQLVRKN